MDELRDILTELHDDVDYDTCTTLIDDRILDSFDIISIVGEFNEAFDVEIDVEDLEPYNFNTVAAMQELIKKLQDE